MNNPYKRVLLKVSGEALKHDNPDRVIDDDFTDEIAGAIGECIKNGVQVAVVIGAGNIWRGAKQGRGMDRCTADNMGMLATCINCLGMQDSLREKGVPSVVLTAFDMPKVAELFRKDKAVEAMEAGKVVLLACGSGNPFFSTDTAAVLRAAELGCDAMMMAKNIDGIYNKDPKNDKAAVRYDELTYKEILVQGLKAIDLTAAALADEAGIPMLVFDANDPINIAKVILGEKKPGTIVK